MKVFILTMSEIHFFAILGYLLAFSACLSRTVGVTLRTESLLLTHLFGILPIAVWSQASRLPVHSQQQDPGGDSSCGEVAGHWLWQVRKASTHDF